MDSDWLHSLYVAQSGLTILNQYIFRLSSELEDKNRTISSLQEKLRELQLQAARRSVDGRDSMERTRHATGKYN